MAVHFVKISDNKLICILKKSIEFKDKFRGIFIMSYNLITNKILNNPT